MVIHQVIFFVTILSKYVKSTNNCSPLHIINTEPWLPLALLRDRLFVRSEGLVERQEGGGAGGQFEKRGGGVKGGKGIGGRLG